MSIEKLQQAMQLIQECIDEYQGEEAPEGDTSGDGSNDSSGSGSMDMGGGNDKVKMAAALMRKKG